MQVTELGKESPWIEKKVFSGGKTEKIVAH